MALHEDRRRIAIRLSVMQGIITVLFSVLGVSFWALQVVQHAKFEEMAENNHQRTLALRAPRGIVFDRNGLHVLVVENVLPVRKVGEVRKSESEIIHE